MFLQDKLTIDGMRRTRDGYLTVNAKVARAGNVQLYAGHEVGKPEMPFVRVYRPVDEVFSSDTMKSFGHRPVTLGHPSSSVTADNWKSVATGWTDGEIVREGEFVRISMMLADAQAIAAVEGGTRQLSAGYDCTLDWSSGVTPSGEAYDAIQRGIRGNHIAIVAAARGGPELRIGDGLPPSEERTLAMMTDAEIRTMRDSVNGMPLWKAQKLPIYDDIRHSSCGGMPAAVYAAIHDGANASQSVEPTEENVRALGDVLAARLAMESDMATAWRRPVNDNQHPHRPTEPQFARDGRPLSSLSDHERSYEKMVHDQANAWKATPND